MRFVVLKRASELKNSYLSIFTNIYDKQNDMVKKAVRKKRRTTEEVKVDIMQAVGNVLEQHGVNKLRVETVAAAAGMDKAMLYRHYKDFNDILKSYIENNDFWLNYLTVAEHSEVTKDNIVDIVMDGFTCQFEELINNIKSQQLLIWELSDKNGLMKNVSRHREDVAIKMLDKFEANFPHKNVSSSNILALITAGIYYLVLHKDVSTFAKIDLNVKEHQEKLLSDLSWLIERIFSPTSETERIAMNCIKQEMDINLISEITGLRTYQIEAMKLDK